MTSPGMKRTPLTGNARERLREQQRDEAERLASVLAAQNRLDAERDKRAGVVRSADEAVARRQRAVDEATAALSAVVGVERTAVLLERPVREVARLVKRCRAGLRNSALPGHAASPDRPMPA